MAPSPRDADRVPAVLEPRAWSPPSREEAARLGRDGQARACAGRARLRRLLALAARGPSD